MQSENNEVIESLSKAYKWLFELADRKGHWEEVRSTALVGLCLKLREREPSNSPWLKHVSKWLLAQQRATGIDEAAWCEELWDTCLALISLRHLGIPPGDPYIQKALNFIKRLYNKNGRHNWHDDPWETSWCIMAIFKTSPTPELRAMAYNGAVWLLNLQDSDGRIVSPHITSYFLQIGHEFQRQGKGGDTFDAGIRKARDYLLSTIVDSILWSGEAWSNGQILWAMASTKQFPCEDGKTVEKVFNWFLNSQNNGHWDDVEDTACAILGLYYLLGELDRIDVNDTNNKVTSRLQSEFSTPHLYIEPRWIGKDKGADGTISIILRPRLIKFAGLLAALASGTAVVVNYWDIIVRFIKG